MRVHILSAVLALSAVGCARQAATEPTEPDAEPGPALAATEPTADTLRALPGVAAVEVLVAVPNPARRIVHVRDWHHVPRNLFDRDIRHAEKRAVPDDELTQRYAAFLTDVDAVQRQQELILGALARDHGTRRVLLEGLTPEGAENYQAVVKGFRGTEVRLAAAAAAAIESQSGEAADKLDKLARELRRDTLPYGAAGRLAGRGTLEVLPLDAAAVLDASAPGADMKQNPAAVEARHDEQVRRALAAGPCAVLVLGGAHDLSPSVRRLGGGTTEYIRVTSKGYADAGR